MGADMCVAMTALHRDVTPDWIAAERYIADATLEQIDPYEIYEHLTDAQQNLQVHLDEFRRYMEGGYHRHFSDIYVGPYTIIIAGGLSWGDAPSEGYDTLNSLQVAGVLDAAGFDPPEFWDLPTPDSDISRKDLLFP